MLSFFGHVKMIYSPNQWTYVHVTLTSPLTHFMPLLSFYTP